MSTGWKYSTGKGDSNFVPRISGRRFFAFLHSAELVVVHLAPVAILGFNRDFSRRFEAERAEGVRFAWMSLFEIALKSPEVLEYLRSWLAELGIRPDFGILPGYYLFRRGELVT